MIKKMTSGKMMKIVKNKNGVMFPMNKMNKSMKFKKSNRKSKN